MPCDASPVKAGIDADEIPGLDRNRAIGLAVMCCRRAGQPKIVSCGVDDQPIWQEICEDHRQIGDGREPRQRSKSRQEARAEETKRGSPSDGSASCACRQRRDCGAVVGPRSDEFAGFDRMYRRHDQECRGGCANRRGRRATTGAPQPNERMDGKFVFRDRRQDRHRGKYRKQKHQCGPQVISADCKDGMVEFQPVDRQHGRTRCPTRKCTPVWGRSISSPRIPAP